MTNLSSPTEKPHVFIIGLGLIGGSLARAIRRNHDVHISGFDVKEEALLIAQDLGIIDTITSSIESGARNADLILLASPVSAVLKTLDVLGNIEVKKDCIITDAASAKGIVCEKAKNVFGHRVHFIGGHPMAGSHKSGIGASKVDLFENAFYFLTPEENTPVEIVNKLQHWLSGTRSKFLMLDSMIHDEIVGVLSHFPHIVAAALVHHLKGFKEEDYNISRFAAGGFRDITRIASSEPGLWQDIVLHNRDVLLELFESWDHVMSQVREQLQNRDIEGIERFFYDAKIFRDQFPVKQKGAIPSTNDLYLDLPDHPGEIGKVTTLIGHAKINITNVQVIEWRETISGILRVSFQTIEGRDLAMKVLGDAGYKTYLND